MGKATPAPKPLNPLSPFSHTVEKGGTKPLAHKGRGLVRETNGLLPFVLERRSTGADGDQVVLVTPQHHHPPQFKDLVA